MFGHDDQSQRHHDDNQPTPDGTLVHDNHVATPPVDDVASDLIEDTPTVGTTLPDPGAALGKAMPNTDVLLDIKQQALQQLTPLIGHLEQTPEEKFRTTMMMIQASDNDTLLKAAYESAIGISDEKTRAQALLDIVNEINYFTHNNTSTEA